MSSRSGTPPRRGTKRGAARVEAEAEQQEPVDPQEKETTAAETLPARLEEATTMTAVQLRQELMNKGLVTTGLKSVLQARLIATIGQDAVAARVVPSSNNEADHDQDEHGEQDETMHGEGEGEELEVVEVAPGDDAEGRASQGAALALGAARPAVGGTPTAVAVTGAAPLEEAAGDMLLEDGSDNHSNTSSAVRRFEQGVKDAAAAAEAAYPSDKDLSVMTHAQLALALRGRELPTTGTKAALRARLVAARVAAIDEATKRATMVDVSSTASSEKDDDEEAREVEASAEHDDTAEEGELGEAAEDDGHREEGEDGGDEANTPEEFIQEIVEDLMETHGVSNNVYSEATEEEVRRRYATCLPAPLYSNRSITASTFEPFQPFEPVCSIRTVQAVCNPPIGCRWTSAKAEYHKAIGTLKVKYPTATRLLESLSARGFATDGLVHESEESDKLDSEVSPAVHMSC